MVATTLTERRAVVTECVSSFARVTRRVSERMRNGDLAPTHFRETCARLLAMFVLAGEVGALDAERNAIELLTTLMATARDHLYN